jgi:hypothetical protein
MPEQDEAEVVWLPGLCSVVVAIIGRHVVEQFFKLDPFRAETGKPTADNLAKTPLE